jgi:hypothetical protein
MLGPDAAFTKTRNELFDVPPVEIDVEHGFSVDDGPPGSIVEARLTHGRAMRTLFDVPHVTGHADQ